MEQEYRNQVIATASGRELEVLKAFADGLNPQQVARQLGIAKKTVDMYKTKLFDRCRIAWNLPLEQRLDYHFFHMKFANVKGDQLRCSRCQPRRLLQLQQKEPSDDECIYNCSQVVTAARGREQEVLKAFADGLTPQQVAVQLSISPKTVDTYKTHLLALCRRVWKLSPKQRIDYHFLNVKFAGFQQYETENT
jgi:DNA-binding CsgD family transcriptional regulator